MSKKSFLVSLILIITVGLTTLAVGWHKYIDASKNPKLISCENHVDSNYDMACDFCGQILPLSNYVEKKEVAIFSEDESLIKVNGMMPKDTLVSSKVIEKDEAFSLAKEHLKDLKKEDVLVAYDISLDSKEFEYQPEDFGQTVTVNISRLNLNIKDNVALLHIIDDNNYEILPVSSFTNEEIKFRATRFSTYILISVESHNVKFSGDGDFKITEVSGDEITNNSQVASGTNFAFSIVPGEGYGITGVTLKTSSGNIIYPSGDSGDNSFVVVGEELGRTCNISSVTEDIEVNVETALIPKITTNIITAKVKFGDAAEFTISADNATTFTWQYRENENDYWHEMSNSIGTSKVSGDTSTFTTTSATDLLSGYDFRCIVGNDVFKDHHGAVSNIAKLIVAHDTTLAYETPIFLTQPVTTKVLVGNKAVYKAKAIGAGLTLTWQYRENDSDYWKDMMNSIGTVSTTTIDSITKESTLTTVETNYAMYQYQFRCLAGNEYYVDHSAIKSNVANIVMTNEEQRTVKYFELGYTKQPLTTLKVKHGEIAVIEVETKGANVYKWQYKSGDFWEDVTADMATGYDTKALNIDTNTMKIDNETLNVTNNLSGLVFRCLIINSDISAYSLASDEVLLIVAQDDINSGKVAITPAPDAPENFVATSGDYADAIEVSWKMFSGLKYRLSYINENSEKVLLSADVTSPYMHVGIEKNKTYEYVIEAYDSNMRYSEPSSTRGSTQYDDIYDVVNKDTIKPVIDNINITPNSEKVGPLTDVTITFNVTDDNYDYNDGCKLFKEDVEVLINGTISTSVSKGLTRAVIPSGERYTLKLNNLIGDGNLSVRIPAGKIFDLAKNGNDEYLINTNITVVRTEVATVKNFTATSGDYTDSIKITWKDTENTNVKYVLEASNKDNNWIVLSDNATSPHMHTGLTKNMSFEYRIKAVAENGDESEYVYTIGRTEYDPLFGDVMIDTVKPTIDLKSKNPELDYLGESQQVTFTFESFDTNYNSNTTTLTKDSFVIKVGGNVTDGVVRTLTKEDIASGERFTLTITNITGNGPLTITVPAGVITDCALNQNDEKDIETGITVMNDATTTDTAPTLVPGVHEIGVTTNQVCAVPIASIRYEYRLSGDGDFNTWNTTTDLSDVIKNLSSDTEYEVRTVVTDVANNTVTSKSAFTRTLKIDASAITITHTPTEWTNQDVTATINWSGDTTYIHQYSTDKENWTTVTGETTDVIFSANGILYARYSDGVGHSDPVEHKIENIDKIKPIIGNVTVPTGKANSKTITVSNITDEGGSGLKGYYINTVADLTDATWTDLNSSSFEFTVTENNTYHIWVIDNAGNISEAYSTNIVDIQDKVTNIEFNGNSDTLKLNVFETKTPSLKYDGTPKSVIFEILDSTIATIDTTTGAITGVAEGTTTAKVTIEDFDGTKYEKTITVKVNAIEPTLIIDRNTLNFNYGDTSKVINITSYNGNGKLSITSQDENVAKATLADNKITVDAVGYGETTLVLKSEKTKQYLAKEVIINVTVTKRVIKVTWSGDSFVYDGTEKEVIATINNIVGNDTVNITYANNKKTNAGNYIAEITSLDNPNYTIDGMTDKTHNWVIEKAEREINLISNINLIFGTPENIEFTYTGEDVTAEVVSSNTNVLNVTLQDGENKGTIEATGVSAGTATITLTIPESENYKSKTAKCDVNVSLASGSIVPDVENIEFTYGDNASEIGYKYGGNGKVTGTSNNEDVAKVTINETNKRITITPVNAGSAVITISTGKTEQYDASEVQITVTVNKRAVILEWSNDTFVYDGNEKEIIATITNKVGNDVVEINAYVDNKKTNAGTYIAKATGVSNDNYTVTNGQNISKEWTIDKADITPTLVMTDYIYAGEKPTPRVEGNLGNGNVTYYYYSGDVADKRNWNEVTSSTYLPAGKYYMVAEVAESSNYNGATTNTVEFNIVVAGIDVTLTEGNEAYDGEWTNNTVTATIEVSDDVKNLEAVYYRYEGETTYNIPNKMTKNGNTVKIDFEDNINKKVYFVGVDVNGRAITGESIGCQIKIDKDKPVIGEVVTPSGKGNTKTITARNIVDYGGSGLYGYYVSDTQSTAGATWTEFTGDSFTYEATENKRYYFYVIDNAGNISDITANSQIEITEIVDKISNITHDDSITVRVFETAKANISYSGEAKEIIYEIEDTNIATVNKTTGVVTGENFGTTKMKVTFKDYDGTTTEISITVNVERAIADMNIQSRVDFIYGDLAKDISYTYTGNGAITATSSNGDVVEVSVDEATKKIKMTPKNVGTAKVTVTAAETSKYTSVSREVEVQVTKRMIVVTWGQDEFTYDGTSKTITATVDNAVNGDDVGLIYTGNTETLAGNYVATITGVKNNNYTIENATNLSHNWKINKADRVITLNPEEITLVYGTDGNITFEYTGEDVTASVRSDKTNIAVIKNFVDGVRNGTITVSPVAKGECNIVIEVPESDNYKYATKNVKVIVERNSDSKITVPDYPAEITYGDDPVRIPFEYDGNGTITAETDSGDIISVRVSGDEIIVKPEGVGTTTITIKASETDQFTETETKLTMTVKPRVVELEWSNDTFTYDGTEKTITATVTNKVGNDVVAVNAYNNNKKTNAGNYIAEALSLNNKNYTLENATNTTHNWVINKADREIVMQDKVNVIFGSDYKLNFTYTGEDVTAIVTLDKNVYMSIKNYLDGTNSGEITIEPLAAGVTILTVTVPESENYNAITKECEVTVGLSEAGLVINNPEITLTYGDDEVQTAYEYKGNGQLTIKSSNENVAKVTIDETGKTITIIPQNAGEATITLTSSETEQYAAGEATIKVTVKKRPVKLSWSNDTFTYDGTVKTITATVDNKVGNDSVNITSYNNNAKTNAGNYEAEALTLDNENYTLVDGENITKTWVINKANRTLTMIHDLVLEYGTTGKIDYTYTGEDTIAEVTSEKTSVATVTNQDGDNSGSVTVTPIAQGTTIVTIVIPETENYNSTSGECLVTIKRNSTEKINISEQDKNMVFTYGDPSKDISYVYNGNGTVTVTIANENVVTATVNANKTITIKPLNAGTTTITINAAETDQYEASSVVINVTVKQRVVTLVWDKDTFTYDGSEKEVKASVTNAVAGDTVNVIEYEENKKVNAGTYTAIAKKLDNDNYTLVGAENVSHIWKIEKADITPVITMDDYIYGGEKAEPSITGNLGNGDVTYFIYSGDDSSKAINWNTVTSSMSIVPGKYNMFAKVAETENYNSAISNTVEFEVKTVNIDVTLKENDAPYDSEWTNNDVIATIKVPAEATTVTSVYYRIEGEKILRSYDGTLFKNNAATINFNKNFNHVIYFVGVNVQGKAVTNESGPYTIKIDKTKPVIGKVEAPLGKANSKIITVSEITDVGESGVTEYYVGTTTSTDNVTWSNFTGTTFQYEVFDNGTYYVFVRDGAGNISDVTANSTIEISNIVDKVSNAQLQDNLVVEVFGTIRPTLTYDGEPKEISYSIENTDLASIDEATGVITGKASGETNVIVKLKDYDGTITELKAKLTVVPKEPTITVNEPSEFVFVYGDNSSETTYNYDGNGTVTVVSNNENIATVKTIDNRIVVTPVNVGTTTITIKASETPQYKAGSKDINVTVKPRPIILKWSSGDFIYDGTEKQVTATVTNLIQNDEVTLTYKDNAKTNAGRYTAEVTAVDNPNYTVVDGMNIRYNWEIKKAPREIQMPEELILDYGTNGEIEYTFTGEDTTATVESTATSVATIKHNAGQNGGRITVTPEGAGKCNVVVTVPETENYAEATAICKITVNAIEPTLEIEDTDITLTYGDAPFTTRYTYNGNGRITVAVSDSEVITAIVTGNEIIITPVGEGKATVSVTSAPTSQYTETTKTINVTVKPLPVILEWNANEFVYDGREKEVFATVKNLVGNDTVELTYAGNKAILAGNYTAEATGTNNHNYTVVSGENITHDWVIKKAERIIDVQDEISLVYGTDGSVEFKYNGEDVTASVLNGNDNVATIKYEDGNNKGTITITPVGLGESIVTINVPESENYGAGTKTFVIKVSRAVPEISVSEKDIKFIYGDNTRNIPYTYTGNGRITATTSDANVASADVSDTTINITPGKVGTATITLTIEETSQYSSITATINVTVKPRPIDVKWGVTTFIYDGTEKTITGTVRNVVPGDVVTITEYEGNKATEKGTYTARVIAVSNDNYTVDGGLNLTTTWEIKELLPPDIIVKQDGNIIESGTWASGDVEVTIQSDVITGVEVTYEYSFNGDDWFAYNGTFTISRETRETTIYARAYNKGNGAVMSLIGQYKLKLDKTNPSIRATEIETTNSVSGIINKDSKITVKLTVEDLISGINDNEFTIEDIKVIVMYRGIQTELTDIKKVLTADASNSGLEYGGYKYTLTLEGITENGGIYLKIGEKSVYDRSLRYNEATSINLNIKADNEGPEVGIIKTSADSYGRIFGNEAELSVTAKDESGIKSYEWQLSRDGKTWETFKTDETSAELSEVIYKAIKEGAHYFRVIVSDIIGNTTTSETARVNVNMLINRKPTIRFETEQISATKVKIIGIIKSTREIESIKVNASEFDKGEWQDRTVKTNNELTITMDYIATSNGTYAWTVVDDLENTVTEKINITTIDESRVIVVYTKYGATEYSRARIEFEGNQLMRIVRVEKPNGDKINIVKGTECDGMSFNTTNYKKNVTVRLNSFEKGTKFIFENKAGLETEVEVNEDIDTKVMYIRVAEGLKKFNEIYGDTFSIKEAEVLVRQMLSKTKGINGSIEPYYGISGTSLAARVSEQEQLTAIGYLSAATNSGGTLKMNQYGDPEKVKATVKQKDTNTYTTYLGGNVTGVTSYGSILNWTGSAIKNTFRMTLRAR